MSVRTLLARLMLLPLAISAAVRAQMPEKFTNLKVLPKEIGKQELMQTMRGFSFSVGVRCDHCHAEKEGEAPGPAAKLDFASDKKQAKQTARAMMQMVQSINRDYLSKIGKPAPVQVECVTCHRALPQPRTVNSVVAEKLDEKGAAEATLLYRELRKKYYGGAEYDFSETPLNRLGEQLNAKDRSKDAVAIMELNAELNAPLTGWGMNVLAMAHKASGATEKAIADYEKILELDPKDRWAKTQLEQLKTPKQ